MSVEKLIITQENKSYTIISNQVLQNLRDIEALGLWCFLSSLPPNWIFYKKYLRDHFVIGRDRLDRLLKTLETHNLISMNTIRNKTGQFSHIEFIVKNGSEFVQKEIEITDTAPSHEIQGTVEEVPLTEIQSPVTNHYKNNIEKNNTNNIKSSCASELDQGFEEFWNEQIHRTAKAPCLKKWRSKKLHKIKDKIIEHVKKLKVTVWAQNEAQFVIRPLTYLSQERWNDEILTSDSKGLQNGISQQPKKNSFTDAFDRLTRDCVEARQRQGIS